MTLYVVSRRLCARPASSSLMEALERKDDQQSSKLVPREKYTHVDPRGGEQVLAHTLLLKRWPLFQGGPWSLVYDDQGFGMLVSSECEQVRFLEEWLLDQVLAQGDELVVVETVAKDGETSMTQWNLSARLRQHEQRNCKALAAGEEINILVFTITRPKSIARLLWGLFSLYTE